MFPTRDSAYQYIVGDRIIRVPSLGRETVLESSVGMDMMVEKSQISTARNLSHLIVGNDAGSSNLSKPLRC